jgi:hypothetical protein
MIGEFHVWNQAMIAEYKDIKKKSGLSWSQEFIE